MASDNEKMEWPDEEMSIKRFNLQNPFTVPSGYFDELGERIMSSVYLSELQERVPAGGLTLPDDYFETSAAQITSRIHIEELASSESEGFTVPADDYFERLQQQITSRIAIEEAAPAQEQSFAVPEGYFEKLNKSILNQTVNQDLVVRKTGVIRKLVSTAAFKYASAACFALIVGGSIFLSQSNSVTNSAHGASYLHKQLSEIPAEEIQQYLQTHVDGNDVQSTMMSEDAPIDYKTLDNSLGDDPAQKQ